MKNFTQFSKTSIFTTAFLILVFSQSNAPATGLIRFSTTDYFDNATVEFIDISGRFIFRKSSLNSNDAVDISQLKSAIYLVKISSSELTYSQKLVKQ